MRARNRGPVVVAAMLIAAGDARAQTAPAARDSSRGVAPPIVEPRMVARAFGVTPDRRPGSDPKPIAAQPISAGLRHEARDALPRPRSEWWAPAASAIIPGAGQARLKQDRFVAYLAVEGFLWARYATDHRAGVRQRSQYRDLALRVSRAPFAGPKPQGDFEYYERMEHWIASGIYDSDPGPTFAPETDTTTFNGAMWLLARKTYWQAPDTPPPAGSDAYTAAIRFYERYAVQPAFQWSWRDYPLHQDVYRRHIRASNDAFRRSIADLGAVIANHVLSTVDAYVSLRLQLRAGDARTDAGVDVGASVPIQTLGSIVRHARLRTPE